MEITSATFLRSSTQLDQMPPDTLPEYAFMGRSNVGKSSLINMLCLQKELAKTSSQPGKTQAINHFLINKNWYLADLPGYGYAKVARTQRDVFRELMVSYVSERKNLKHVFLLIDSRISPQAIDLEFNEFLQHEKKNYTLLFTKCDKIGVMKQKETVENFFTALEEQGLALPPHIITSSLYKNGRTEVLSFIGELNKQ